MTWTTHHGGFQYNFLQPSTKCWTGLAISDIISLFRDLLFYLKTKHWKLLGAVPCESPIPFSPFSTHARRPAVGPAACWPSSWHRLRFRLRVRPRQPPTNGTLAAALPRSAVPARGTQPMPIGISWAPEWHGGLHLQQQRHRHLRRHAGHGHLGERHHVSPRQSTSIAAVTRSTLEETRVRRSAVR